MRKDSVFRYDASRQWIGLVLIGFVAAALAFAAGTIPAAAVEAPSYADLAEEVKHAVVNISTTKIMESGQGQGLGGPSSPLEEFFNRFFGQMPRTRRKANALGSGFLIDDKGLILTNNHVVAQADKIQVVLQNQQEFDAKVVGRDPKTDLALIQIESSKGNLPDPAPLGDSDELRVGDAVMAVGNPFGLGHTVTVGIISAKGRVIGAGPYDDFLQTDAAINPGNSGGPLFNMDGEVVGINTAIVATGQGIGFAIPVNLAKELLPQLKTGRVTRGWLGIVIQDLTPELAESFGMETSEGVLIANVVEDGPAEKAGLQRGDVITALDGTPVKSAQELSRKVAGNKPGQRIELRVHRNGEKQTVNVRIGEMPDAEGAREGGMEEVLPDAKWGLTVQPLTPDLARRLGLKQNEAGVVVTGVEPDSPAGKAGLTPGDLIQEINRKPIESREDLTQAIREAEGKGSLLLLVKRGRNTFYVVLEAEGEK
ncbi:MAG: DegQ family serine endoprotease [Desulfobacterales bacterium]|nr:DegQ family serine endoprotease [Desulfobacterales bacterium]